MNRHPLIILCWLLLGLFCAQLHAEATAAKTVPPRPTEIQPVIDTLENPEARERLIGQLKLMIQAQQASDRSPPAPTLGGTSVDLLRILSEQLAKSVETTVKAATLFNELPRVADWFRTQLSNLERRNLWLGVIENLLGIIGGGYLAFFIARWLLKRLREPLERRPAQGLAMRMTTLLAWLLVNLLPIIAFAAVGIVVLSLTQPAENIRLVAIAWINAAVIVRALWAVSHFFFAPRHAQFRLLPIGDRMAQSLVSWLQWLGFTVVYGYFALQAALLIGIPLAFYETLLRLLGLLVSVLLMALVIQNRRNVASHFFGMTARESKQPVLQHILQQLASVWHVVAIIYILILYLIWALALTGGFLFILRATLLTALILIAGNWGLRFIEQALSSGFGINQGLRQRFPNLEQRLNRYRPVLQTAINGLGYLLMALAILQSWGISTLVWITTGLGRTFSTELIKIGAIVLTTVLLWEGITLLTNNYLDSANGKQPSARLRTLLSVAHNALLIVLLVMSTLIILSELGINIAPLLAGVGVVGLAVGFGAQKLVQDIITGLFILFGDLISVGDVVSVAGKDGLVEALTIRAIRLRDDTGSVHTIPFSAIGPITNMTRDFSYYVFNVAVSYQEDIDYVMDALSATGQQIMLDSRYAPFILSPLEILGVDSFSRDAVMIKARIKTLPIKQWDVGREFNRLMKKQFDQLAIAMYLPAPAVDKEGEAKKPIAAGQ